MNDGRRRTPRRWLAVASLAGMVTAALMLSGPAHAATPQSTPTASNEGPIGGNN